MLKNFFKLSPFPKGGIRGIFCCSTALLLLSLFTASRFTLHEKLNLPYPSLKKRDFLRGIFLIIPLCKGGTKRGISLKNQISLYPSIEKRDFLSEIIFIIPLDKGGIRGIFYCSTALLLYRYGVWRCLCFCSRNLYGCENSQAKDLRLYSSRLHASRLFYRRFHPCFDIKK